MGGPIITRATHEALELDAPQVLQTKEEIGCPEPACRLRSAIVVPLEKRGEPVGTLKFYYTSDRYLNENQLAMAEGLARLLSTQLELSELERQTELATQMELKALQAQINPHFLFNTINTIAAFIRTDPTEARRLLRQFGTFYRRTLEEADDLVTLDRELEFVDTYVQLEKARFGDRLEFVQDVEAGAHSCALPAFMIQPLVENAVGHGMRPEGDTLHVTVSARVVDGALTVIVADDGVGISADRLPTSSSRALAPALVSRCETSETGSPATSAATAGSSSTAPRASGPRPRWSSRAPTRSAGATPKRRSAPRYCESKSSRRSLAGGRPPFTAQRFRRSPPQTHPVPTISSHWAQPPRLASYASVVSECRKNRPRDIARYRMRR